MLLKDERRFDPENAADRFRWRYVEACRLFIAGEMSVDVFRATLFGLGYRGQEIESEVSLRRGVDLKEVRE